MTRLLQLVMIICKGIPRKRLPLSFGWPEKFPGEIAFLQSNHCVKMSQGIVRLQATKSNTLQDLIIPTEVMSDVLNNVV